jgi:hypothetical protein
MPDLADILASEGLTWSPGDGNVEADVESFKPKDRAAR